MLQSHYWATSNFSSPKGFFDDDLQKWKGATKDALDYELVQQAALPPESFTKQEVSNYYRKKLSETSDPAERIAWFQRLVENEAAGTEDIVNKKFFSEWIAFLLGKTDPKTVEYKTISETPWHLPDDTYPVGTGLVREGRWKLEEQPPIRRQDEGGKEIRAYINTFTDRHFDFMMKIISLKLNGPKSLNDHWLFFKYIVKGHAKDFGTRPLPELFLDYKDFMDPEKQNNVFTDAKSVTPTSGKTGDDTGYSRFIQDDPGIGGPTEPMQHDTGGDKSKDVPESYIQKLYNRYNSKPTTDNLFNTQALTFTKDLLEKENARKARERLDVEPDPKIKGASIPYDKSEDELTAEEREANHRWHKRRAMIDRAETAEMKKLKEQQWDYDEKRKREFLEIQRRTKTWKSVIPNYDVAETEAKEALAQLERDDLSPADRAREIKIYNDAIKKLNSIPVPTLHVSPNPAGPQLKASPNPNTNPAGPPQSTKATPKPKPAPKKSSQTQKTTTGQQQTPTATSPSPVTTTQQPPVTTTTTQSSPTVETSSSSATAQEQTPTTTTTTQSAPQQPVTTSQTTTSTAETSTPPAMTSITQSAGEQLTGTETSSPSTTTPGKEEPSQAWYDPFGWWSKKENRSTAKEAAERLFATEDNPANSENLMLAKSFLAFLEGIPENASNNEITQKWRETIRNEKIPEEKAALMITNFFNKEELGNPFNNEKAKYLKELSGPLTEVFGVSTGELLLQAALSSGQPKLPEEITFYADAGNVRMNKSVLARAVDELSIPLDNMSDLEKKLVKEMYTYPISSNAVGWKLPKMLEKREVLFQKLFDTDSNLIPIIAQEEEYVQEIGNILVANTLDENKTLKQLYSNGLELGGKYGSKLRRNATRLNDIFKNRWKKKSDPAPSLQPSGEVSSKPPESPTVEK